MNAVVWTNNPAWHPRIREVLTSLRDAQAATDTWLDELDPSFRAQHPAEGGWSISHVVEHLAMVEDGSGRRIGALIKETVGTDDGETSPIAPSMERFRVWQPIRPVVAPPMVTPTGTVGFDEARHAQQTARARLMAAFDAASGRDLASVSAPHPALGVLNAYQWGLFIAHHQHRHLHQMRSILSTLRS